MFKKHALEAMAWIKKIYGLEGTLFINYTGHQGAIAAALAMNSIQSSLHPFSERIANSIQDSAEEIVQALSGPTIENSHGLILESIMEYNYKRWNIAGAKTLNKWAYKRFVFDEDDNYLKTTHLGFSDVIFYQDVSQGILNLKIYSRPKG